MRNSFWILVLTLVIFSSMSHGEEKKTKLSGAYFGQQKPGLSPNVFAPGIISTDGWEVSGVFSPDLKELYFLRGIIEDKQFKQQFVVFKNQGSYWSEKVISGRVGQPFVSPDGNIMHLGKRYMTRTSTGWSKIKSLGVQFEPYRIMRMTASDKGMVVFDEAKQDGTSKIRYSRLVNGEYEKPKAFSESINTGQYNVHPFIAPDESYLIWDGQRGVSERNADLFISFKQNDGSWGEAIKFGDEINTSANETGARVTPDGKFLFFNRNMGSFTMMDKDGEERTLPNMDVFWVDAKVIEELRPKS